MKEVSGISKGRSVDAQKLWVVEYGATTVSGEAGLQRSSKSIIQIRVDDGGDWQANGAKRSRVDGNSA